MEDREKLQNLWQGNVSNNQGIGKLEIYVREHQV